MPGKLCQVGFLSWLTASEQRKLQGGSKFLPSTVAKLDNIAWLSPSPSNHLVHQPSCNLPQRCAMDES